MTWFRSRVRRRSPKVGPPRAHRSQPCVEPLEDRLTPAVFTVLNVGDTGTGVGDSGDLRYCINRANATPGLDIIQFAIPGTGVHTINVTSALPAITDPVLLDGYTQAGASANTLANGDNAVLTIELNGASAGAGVSGLTVSAGGSTVRGLVINRFDGAGITVSGASAVGSTIEGNFIGTNATGTAALGNLGMGVYLQNSPGGVTANNTIGGTTAAARNIISANRTAGILLLGSSTTGNLVAGNYIGTDVTGTAALGNSNASLGNQAVAISLDNAPNNTIGGTTPGAGNLISGNTAATAIALFGTATGTTIQGNLIGTDVTGNAALANRAGIAIASANNLIGGSVAGAGNIISGNIGQGIYLAASGATGNTIAGNTIGLGADGSTPLGNTNHAILVLSAPNNTIGGTTAAARNVISSNSFGIFIEGSSPGTTIEGNYIGTDATGMLARGNGFTGAGQSGIYTQSPNTTIGGIAPGAGNLISGNTGIGITLGFGSAGSVVQGNLIGTNAAGTAALGNALLGIYVLSANNLIGGTTAAARNVISSNGGGGIQLATGSATGNVVAGNYIGTDFTGTVDLGNTGNGVTINSAPGNTIGGGQPGAGNVISGNNGYAIAIGGTLAANNVVAGNRIGTTFDGAAVLSNSSGILINGAPGTRVGTDGDGAGDATEGNLVVGTGLSFGLLIEGDTADNSVIAGNFFGTNAAGTALLGSFERDIYINDSSVENTRIGTNADGVSDALERNVIVGSFNAGLLLLGSHSVVAGNYFGVDVTGQVALSGGDIRLLGGATGNTIGGTSAGARNVISGNLGYGVSLDGVTSNTVAGNYIGLAADGTTPLGNRRIGAGFGYGVWVHNGATGNTIGGTASGAGNVISGNAGDGVSLTGPGTTGNLVQGNYIGTDASGMLDLGNTGSGVLIEDGASGNTIGGLTSLAGTGAGNLLSGNGVYGVVVNGLGSFNPAPAHNLIAGNLIGLAADGVTLLGNGDSGVLISYAGGGNVVGGGAAGARNVISGNAVSGVIAGASPDTVVAGNYVGTDRTGQLARGNRDAGVVIAGSDGSRVGTDGDGVNDAGEGNLIAANATVGLLILYSDNVVVAGNTIGLAADGTTARGNGYEGLRIEARFAGTTANNNRIGTNADGVSDELERNIISGNVGAGVQIIGFPSATVSGNVVAGNYIGTDASGRIALSNLGHGVVIEAGATDNLIGGTTAARNVISGNQGDGVEISGSGTSGNVVASNFIGTGESGTIDLGNGGDGVQITGGASSNRIDGNVISGNGGHGVFIGGVSSTANVVDDNYIGLSANGNTVLANDGDGVHIADAVNNLIGDTSGGDANVISGNRGTGVVISGVGARGNVVAANRIGTDATRTFDRGNAGDGVRLQGGASNNTVGGSTPTPGVRLGNLISGNDGSGVVILGNGSTSNVVAGNLIGTNSTGTDRLGNTFWGVLISDAAGNTIGGTTSTPGTGPGNVISGNLLEGVRIQGSNATLNQVLGNYIGTNAAGSAALGNGADGIRIDGGASNNLIGEANVIGGNAGAGVAVVGSGAIGNRILGNSIFANAGLGIDLGDDGVTLNGSAGHSGPNNFQNFPLLTQVTASGASRTAHGHLSSSPNTTFRIEFFANDAYDPSGYGEGQVYLGFVDVTTDASGLASFTFTYTADPAHPCLTATATDPDGNTSEFSGRDLPPVNLAPGPQTTDENVSLTFSGPTALSISDPDNNGSDPLEISLTVNYGTLTLTSFAELAGSGNGTSSLTYAGTLDALNAALAGLVYTPVLGFDGSDILTLMTSDLVAPELGGPGTTNSPVPITVVDTVNPPNLAVLDASGTEGQAIPIFIQASTVDTDGSEILSIQISGVPDTATLSAGTNDGNGVWTLTAEQLDGLTLFAADNFTVTLTVQATTTQVAIPGGSHPPLATSTRTLTVTATNVAPTATLGNDGPITAGDSGTVFFADPSDPSPADTAAGFRYSFARSAADLAASYDAASQDASQSFVFDRAGTYTVFGRIFDKDGGFTDYTTTVTVLVGQVVTPPGSEPPPMSGGGEEPPVPSPLPPDLAGPTAVPPVAPAPTPNPTFPEPISLLPLLTLPSLPVSPPPSTERPIITVGGGDTPGTDQSTIPSTPTRSAELVVSFDSNISGGSFAPPSVSPVGAFQVGMVIGRGGQDADRAPPGPEAQSLVQATQVVATTNDGDDNVRVVELLLARNNVPTTPRESSPPVGNAPPIPGDLPVAVPVAEEAAPDDTSPPLTSLVKWLAIPAAVALAATGWFWRRRGQKSSR